MPNHVIDTDGAVIPRVSAIVETATTDQDVNLVEIDGTAITLGQKASAASLPVVLPSDQDVEVVGNVASGATDSGNPVKVGAPYRSTKPTYTDGQRGDLQIGTRGSLIAQLSSADGAAGVGAGVLTGALTSASVGLNVNAGILGHYDDVSPTAPTENQLLVLRMNAARALYVENGPYAYGRVTADGQIKGSAGFLHTVSIAPLTATPTAGLLTIYDSLTETGTVIYSEWIFATDVGHTITLDVPFATGCYVGFDGTLANVQVTASYR